MPSASRKTKKNHRKPTIVVGKLHAHWCMHCVALAPEWKKMKNILNSIKHTYNLVFEEIEQAQEKLKVLRVNNTHLARSSKKLSVQGGYPTLFKIKNGKIEYYNGERYAAPMAKWFSGGEGGSESLPQNAEETNATKESNKHNSSFFSYKTFGLGGGSKRRQTRKRR
jgi:thiol-disulfide isomerase/thioredoxin